MISCFRGKIIAIIKLCILASWHFVICTS